MKTLKIICGVLLMAGLLTLPCSATPKTVLKDPVYTFESLPEGESITHDFIIRNDGDVPLNITKVQPPWGCDKRAFDRQIPPGGEGKITIGIKTTGYGGKTLNKRILVETDDPEKARFYLTVTGPVEKVVDITPKTVSLSGKPGQVLDAVVTITPAEKYRFSILDMKQRFNTNITAQLVKPETDAGPWRVKITSSSDKPGNLYEIITLKTDSKYRPSLRIRVYALYTAPVEKKPDPQQLKPKNKTTS